MPWDLDVAAIWAETGELAAEDAADAENLAKRGLWQNWPPPTPELVAAAAPGSPGPRAGSPAGPTALRAGSAPGNPWMSRRAGRRCWGSPSGSPTTGAARWRHR